MIFTHALRLGVVRFPRGSLLRNACIGVIKATQGKCRLPPRLAEVRPLDRPALSFEATDSMVMDAIYWFGVQGYEGRMADVWESLCSQARNVVEVGANVGLFTVLGGKATSGSYLALEPVPGVADILRRNLARNGLSDKVEVYQSAAIPDATQSTVALNIPNEGRDSPVGSHLVVGSEVTGRSSLQVIHVAGLPFRQLVRNANLIKVDAEGLEAQLFESARSEIAGNTPTIVAEVLPESTRLASLLRELAITHGYTINIIPAYGTNRIDVVEPQRFDSKTPLMSNSKDVVLSRLRLT